MPQVADRPFGRCAAPKSSFLSEFLKRTIGRETTYNYLPSTTSEFLISRNSGQREAARVIENFLRQNNLIGLSKNHRDKIRQAGAKGTR